MTFKYIVIAQSCHYNIHGHHIIMCNNGLSSKVQHLGHRIYIIKSRRNEISEDIVAINTDFSIKNFHYNIRAEGIINAREFQFFFFFKYFFEIISPRIILRVSFCHYDELRRNKYYKDKKKKTTTILLNNYN